MFNNIWGIIVISILIFIIYKKINNLNKPYDENEFIIKYKNQLKLRKKINLPNFMKNIPSIASYYVGIK
jgi:hypothetical protein